MKRTAAHRADAAIHSKKTPSTTAQWLIAQWQLCNSWFKASNISSASPNDGACTGALKADLETESESSTCGQVKRAWR